MAKGKMRASDYILNHLAHLESIVAKNADHEPTLCEWSKQQIEEMRARVLKTRDGLDACDADYLVNAAISLGSMMSTLSDWPALMTHRNLRERQRRGGESSAKIAKEHWPAIERQATMLRTDPTQPRLRRYKKALCEALATWIENDTTYSNGEAVAWKTVQDNMSDYLKLHFESDKMADL